MVYARMAVIFFFLMIRRPPRSTLDRSSAASDVYKRQHVYFAGTKQGKELAAHYCSADIFVFPSKTDTFGIVLLESLACGLPVAAYNVTGPKDIVKEPFLGALDNQNLAVAARKAMAQGHPEKCKEYAGKNFSWASAAQQFLEAL